ncbi:MAG: metallophosphoesterase [Eubacteriaceae bacterium]|nr:metallophosphoesterase [Eubacteriaceae bacterium]
MKEYSILHLADMHIGKLNDSFKHAFNNNSTEVSEVVEKIMNGLADTRPDFLVISGDMVCNGATVEEHRESVKTINALIGELGIKNKKRVFVVPGNHDIDRSADCRNRFDNYINIFLNEFYEQENCDRIPNIIISKEKDYSSFGRNNWVYKDHEHPVVFINLWSAHPFVPEQIPKGLLNRTDRNNGDWFFDRGLVPAEQLSAIERQITRYRSGNYLIVAIVHHNLMPIIRTGFRVDDHFFPEINMLANGPEVLRKLSEWGVSIVLHGHRHQNNIINPIDLDSDYDAKKFFSRNLFVIGAPSVGLNIRALSRDTPPKDFLGYNLIKIRHSTYNEISGDIIPYREQPSVETRFIKKATYPIEIVKNTHEPIKYCSSRQGLKELGNQLIEARQGVTILHYHHNANWYNEHDNDSPVKHLWQKVKNDSDALSNAENILFPNFVDGSQKLVMAINKSIENDYYDRDLIALLDGKWDDIHEALKGTDNGNKFLQLIGGLPSENTRLGNYSIELLRLACQQEFTIHKCIYFWTNIKENKEKKELYGKGEWAINKMRWLMDSILACCNFKNLSYSWMPFGISGHLGQSVISLLYGGGENSNAWPASILIGYGEKVLTNRMDDDKSVLFIPHDYNTSLPSGRLMQDVRVLLKKLIYPLSWRLQDDFPLFKDGSVYFNNIKILANAYDSVDLLGEFEEKLKIRRANIVTTITISPNRVDSLFRWVVSDSNAMVENNNTLFIPWDIDDYTYLKNKIS